MASKLVLALLFRPLLAAAAGEEAGGGECTIRGLSKCYGRIGDDLEAEIRFRRGKHFFRELEAASLARRDSNEPFYVVQVGAHVGRTRNDPIFPYAIAHGGWRGVLVEPVPEYFAELQRNYKGSGLALENAAICAGDAGGVTRTIHYSSPEFVDVYTGLRADGEGKGGSGEVLGTMPWASQTASLWSHNIERTAGDEASIPMVSAEVACISLPTLLAKHRIPRIDLLLIDAEGADLEVLQSAPLQLGHPLRPKMVHYEHAGGASATGWYKDGFWMRQEATAIRDVEGDGAHGGALKLAAGDVISILDIAHGKDDDEEARRLGSDSGGGGGGSSGAGGDGIDRRRAFGQRAKDGRIGYFPLSAVRLTYPPGRVGGLHLGVGGSLIGRRSSQLPYLKALRLMRRQMYRCRLDGHLDTFCVEEEPLLPQITGNASTRGGGGGGRRAGGSTGGNDDDAGVEADIAKAVREGGVSTRVLAERLLHSIGSKEAIEALCHTFMISLMQCAKMHALLLSSMGRPHNFSEMSITAFSEEEGAPSGMRLLEFAGYEKARDLANAFCQENHVVEEDCDAISPHLVARLNELKENFRE